MDKFNEDLPVSIEGEVLSAMEAAQSLLDVKPAEFGALHADGQPIGQHNLDLLLDVEMPVSVEVGRTRMTLKEILHLVPGSVLSLDKRAEDPVDMRVNGKLVARGEVVLVDDDYGIRVTQIVGQGEDD